MNLAINFEIGDKLGSPLIKILIDDYIVLYEGNAVNEFNREFELNYGEHELKIVHYGKSDNDHVYNPDGTIAIDKYVYIKSIKIDQIPLTDRELQTGEFWPVYSLSYINTIVDRNEELPGCIVPNLYLGHNGTWKYTFTYPFAEWIINLRNQGPKLESTIFKTSTEVLQEAKNFFKDAPDL